MQFIFYKGSICDYLCTPVLLKNYHEDKKNCHPVYTACSITSNLEPCRGSLADQINIVTGANIKSSFIRRCKFSHVNGPIDGIIDPGDCIGKGNLLYLITRHQCFPAKYANLRRALEKAKLTILNRQKESDGGCELHLPKLGGGGDHFEWDSVEDIVRDVFKDAENIDVIVFLSPNAQ